MSFDTWDYRATNAYRPKLAPVALCETAQAALDADRRFAIELMAGASQRDLELAVSQGDAKLKLAAQLLAETIPDDQPSQEQLVRLDR